MYEIVWTPATLADKTILMEESAARIVAPMAYPESCRAGASLAVHWHGSSFRVYPTFHTRSPIF